MDGEGAKVDATISAKTDAKIDAKGAQHACQRCRSGCYF